MSKINSPANDRSLIAAKGFLSRFAANSPKDGLPPELQGLLRIDELTQEVERYEALLSERFSQVPALE